jgi:hypothetical protein
LPTVCVKFILKKFYGCINEIQNGGEDNHH